MPVRPPPRKLNRRARSTSRRDHVLDVRIRTSTARRRRQEKLGRWIWGIFLVAVISTGAFFSIRATLNKFFFQNPEYTLRRITLNLDEILTREEVLTQTGLHEGVNIFSVDLARVEASLKSIPQVDDVRIERELPDHLTISVTARQPVAWVAAEGETGETHDPSASDQSLLVDAGGFLMHPRHILPSYYHLPAIYGVKSDNLRAGEPVQNDGLRLALKLLDTVARHPESLLRIRTINVSRGYCLEVVSSRNARIIFATTDFENQLACLRQLLAHCEEAGRTLATVNLMVKRNTPVTFAANTPLPDGQAKPNAEHDLATATARRN